MNVFKEVLIAEVYKDLKTTQNRYLTYKEIENKITHMAETNRNVTISLKEGRYIYILNAYKEDGDYTIKIDKYEKDRSIYERRKDRR